MMATTLDINEEIILEVLTSKKNALFSFDEEEQKQVIREFVDKVVILPSESIDDFSAGVT
jgi:site-specific DNA recombinase